MSVVSGRDWVRGRERTHLSLSAARVTIAGLTVAFGAAAVADVSVPLAAQMVVYLVGMVALNLPHGGYEHFANLRRREWTFRWRYLAAYLGGVGAFVALFLLAPVAGLALALVVAMAKGGLGDLRVLDAATGSPHLQTTPQRYLAAAVRGGAVMLVPIVFFPETFHAFSSLMVGMVDPGGLAPYADYFDLTRPLIAGGYGLALVAHVALGYVRGGGEAWLVDAGESVLLAVYFAVVPVVVAVGLYFPFWYSARQTARASLVDREPASEDAPDLLGEDPERAALTAWGIAVVGALATGLTLAAVYLAVPNPLPGGLLAGGVAFWSVFISIVALPHVVVGSLWDDDRGIWYVP
jgi:Brp/Blh family beta-carotene 15,15'-monooxygenase